MLSIKTSTSIVSLFLIFASISQISLAQIPGCTNAQACNFNPAANQDDGTCQLPVWYIPATTNGIFPMILTCEAAPQNYILADQNCAATIAANDPFCVNTDWDNLCQNAYNICVFGCAEVVDCLDPNACNYDPTGICDRDLCTYPGCTDPNAFNYNPAAGCDNGSCTFFNECDNLVNVSNVGLDFLGYTSPANWITDLGGGNGSVSISQFVLTIVGENTSISNVLTKAQIMLPVGGNFSFTWQWATNDLPQFDPAFIAIDGVPQQLTNNVDAVQSGTFNGVISDGGSIEFYIDSTDGCCGASTLQITLFRWPGECIYGCFDPTACNFEPLTNVLIPCTYSGCTDPLACNFNVNAGCDDGSCQSGGCTDPLACNYDVFANCDNGSCVLGPVNDICQNAIPLVSGTYTNSGTCSDDFFQACQATIYNDVWFTFVATGGEVSITQNGLNTDFMPYLMVSESCEYDFPLFCSNDVYNPFCSCIISNNLNIPCGLLNPGQTYYLRVGGDAYYNFLESEFPLTGEFTLNFTQQPAPAIFDCADPQACNYNPDATCGDILCTYPGCTDVNACNYDPAAGCLDNSCLYFDCKGICDGPNFLDECGQCITLKEYQRTDYYYDNDNGGPQLFVAGPGVFKIELELFGGIGYGPNPGRGAHVTGELFMNPGDTLYIVTNTGRGAGDTYSGAQIGAGGGATDIRLSPNDLSSRIAVAGGGGGGYINFNGRGGDAGGLIGSNGNSLNEGIDATGGTQSQGGTIGGSFGAGAPATATGAAGGGGWYGGGSNLFSGGGAGSSYIGGIENGIAEENNDPFFDNSPFAIITSYMLNTSSPCYTGCTDPLALNFEPEAQTNDGSCQYIQGCTYVEAENYNPSAGTDDGSCIFPPAANDCAADITGDGFINTNDLLALLSVFGTTCQ